ncbi:MAG: hypothetical protein AAF556_09650 [Pseudomonadota bacterium]
MAQRRMLIGAIVLMGFGILACLVVIGVELAKRASNVAADLTVDAVEAVATSADDVEPRPVVDLSNQTIAVPSGFSVRQIEVEAGRLVIWLTNADLVDSDQADQILLIDLNNPSHQTRLTLEPQAR